MQLTGPANETVWNRQGWSWDLVEDATRAVLVISLREQGAGNPALFVDAPVVLSFAKDMDLSTECSAYSGGLSFKFGFGDYAGHTLTMLHWHSLLHETDSGDVAPGLGEFKVNAEGES